ncbi:tRNA (adenine(58)-N(1))-methyltransferase catalytic subunit trm61 [Colletotrichum truncatum]|uniref:tRNA (Adenine(58)-N(1))-methyltransferase catalytic subunit trm61 n=1 Tax=Colletotrichum truncatum TaxID=5467 RepID=A0ACC3ZHX3_COLTU|nr:tRNA (adenine(58)-N(1))-methyltransferase catalytic subunit trm61 [Colletotrichum truncatum]KAF6781014.1 tRNA (adenine(58)-N(1))-methyltransferase catalytic subunit trm61 [Colletotrichum truncatum]
MVKPSPFLEPGPRTSANSIAVVQLSRDNLVPLILRDSTGAVDGYAEGAVLNTRFGSFPHSTLINVPWGSQIRASNVDTGSRGRKRKRKEEETDVSTPAADDADADSGAPVKKAVAAASGFVHILQPTAELWTAGLPHRTQVVYTPDYSFVLQRIRARPGTRLIEAGAGSGSFSHASARAVYNGYPENDTQRKGKVFSFEFNKDRYEKMQEEIQAHALEGIVQLTHRDVYNGGFLVDGKSPEAESIFLDLPAPWEALPHLSRRKPAAAKDGEANAAEWVSPLNPKKSAYICTFSPCIEQVQKTINTMRTLGWVDIDMIEISNKKFNVIRDRAGMGQPERGIAPSARDVTEAVGKLREIEKRTREFHNPNDPNSAEDSPAAANAMDIDQSANTNGNATPEEETNVVKPWLQGRVIHRAEPELKTHTSYLVFAVLPREWSEEEEAAALAKWPCGSEKGVIGTKDKETRKQEKRDLLQGKGRRRKNKA